MFGQAASATPGTFTTLGDVTIATPVITGARGSTPAGAAAGALVLAENGDAGSVRGGLGSSFTFTGASVVANTNVILPSGEIVLHALSGDVTVGGTLNAAGTSSSSSIHTYPPGRILLVRHGRRGWKPQRFRGERGLGKAGTLAINAAGAYS